MKSYVRIYSMIALLGIMGTRCQAQADNEIQVYSSPTVEKHTTMFELHTNYTIRGSDYLADADQAHYFNATLEITHGFGNNFESGLYLFTTFSPNGNYIFLGSHIRPRVTVPDAWKWPFGASLSVEFGFFRPSTMDPFHWEGEIRPILDRTFHKWYVALNPNVDFILNGPNKHWGFGPQVKGVYTVNQKFGVGAEYYSEIGTFRKINPINEQSQLIGPAFDLYTSPKWELNFGYLFGLTPGSNRQVVKLIIGRHVGRRMENEK